MGSKLMKVEINATTGQVIERELTAAELKQEAQDQAAALSIAEKRIEQEEAKKLVLDKLGLTSDDLKALGL